MTVKVAVGVRGKGEPLVLLHGLGATRRIWHRATPLLAGEHHVIAPDLPGFGASAPAGPGFDFDAVCAAIAPVLRARAGGRFDLLGSSLGGAVALRLALAQPELVRRLVLVAPAGFAPRTWPVADVAGALGEPALALRRLAGRALVGSASARRLLLWGAVAQPAELRTSDARLVLTSSGSATRLGPALAAALRADHLALLSELGTPLGLIWGERDRVVPFATLDTIRSVRGDVVVETIPDAAHIPQLERPAEFVAAVRRVLDRLG